MRSRFAVVAVLSLAFTGVSIARAQSLVEPRDLVLHPWHRNSVPDQKPPASPDRIPDWAPPGVELAGRNGVTNPRVLHDVKPFYTADAMHAKIQGDIVLQGIVEKDGRVGEVRVVSSLDKVHGLDDEAVKAVKKWRFTPATKDGVPVPVVVSIEMTFTLR